MEDLQLMMAGSSKIMAAAHQKLGCAPASFLSKYLGERYYSFPRSLVKEFVSRCPICSDDQPLKSKKSKPNCVIKSKSFGERFQVDLIDMRSVSPAEYGYSYILHLKNHTSLLSRAVAIENKTKRSDLESNCEDFAKTRHS